MDKLTLLKKSNGAERIIMFKEVSDKRKYLEEI